MNWNFFKSTTNQTLAIGTQRVVGTGDASAVDIVDSINSRCDEDFAATQDNSTEDYSWYYRSYGHCGVSANAPVQIDVEGAGHISSEQYSCMANTLFNYSHSLPRFCPTDRYPVSSSSPAGLSPVMITAVSMMGTGAVLLLLLVGGSMAVSAYRRCSTLFSASRNNAPEVPFNAMHDVENPDNRDANRPVM